MFFKKKTTDKHIKEMRFDWSMDMPIDSSLSDDELQAHLIKHLRGMINHEDATISVRNVTRDGNGVIEHMRASIHSSYWMEEGDVESGKLCDTE